VRFYLRAGEPRLTPGNLVKKNLTWLPNVVRRPVHTRRLPITINLIFSYQYGCFQRNPAYNAVRFTEEADRDYTGLESLDSRMAMRDGSKIQYAPIREFRADVLDAVGVLYRRHGSNATARTQYRHHSAELIEGAVSQGPQRRCGVRVDPAEIAPYLSQLHFLRG
jgi:hypothetical protein